jgi:hypothetical protein
MLLIEGTASNQAFNRMGLMRLSAARPLKKAA